MFNWWATIECPIYEKEVSSIQQENISWKIRHGACPQEIKSKDNKTGIVSNCEAMQRTVIEVCRNITGLLNKNTKRPPNPMTANQGISSKGVLRLKNMAENYIGNTL